MRPIHVIGALTGAALYLLALSPVMAAPCYGLDMFKASFRVVFPEARQITMEGGLARMYLEAYNRYGTRTAYEGKALLLNILPNGTVMMVPLTAGQGCKRLIVGPRLHQRIMAEIERSAI